MLNEECDVDPDDPDHDYHLEFLPSDRKEWDSKNPQHVLQHDCALVAFEARRQERIRKNMNTSQKLTCGFIKENHVAQCTCSYCGNSYDKGLKLGLNLPTQWRASNAWFVWARKESNGSRTYYRTTRGLFLRSFLPGQPNQAA